MTIKKYLKNRDFVSGIAFIAVGTLVALKAHRDYPIGTLSHMEPGYFPLGLGILLALVGAVVTALALGRENQDILPAFGWRPVIAIFSGLFVFSQLIERTGIVPAAICLTIVAAAAEKPYRFKRSLLLGCFLGCLAWLIFVVGLEMNLSAFAFRG